MHVFHKEFETVADKLRVLFCRHILCASMANPDCRRAQRQRCDCRGNINRRLASAVLNESEHKAGREREVAADASQAAYMEDYKYFTSEYQARIVMADAQNQARQQAMSAGFNLLSGSILTAAAFL